MRESTEPGRWPRLAALLDELLDLAPAARADRLAALRRSDPDLAARIAPLLAAAETESPLLDQPLGDLAADLLSTALPGDDAVAAPDAPGPGRMIGPWRLGRRLGQGGMGVVFEAERADGQYDQRVALKLLNRLDHAGDLARRLAHERRVLARLEHPGIARLLDGGLTPAGLPWFAMELVEGAAVTTHCERSGLTLRERVRIFLAVCEAVAYAHQHLVVHRDLKPSNILVTGAGEIKLVDFGIAKLLAEDESEVITLTRAGDRVLTPRYAAPEQIRGEPVTTATDVHALGAVLYELLAGYPPFGDAESSALELEQAVLRGEPEPLSRSATTRSVRRMLRGDLGTIVGKALGKRPADRYGSAEALGDDLQRWLDGLPIRARRPSLRYRFGKYLRRHRLEVGASAVIVLVLAGGLAGTTWQARRAAQQAHRAERVRAFLVGMFSAADPARARGREVSVREVLDQGAARIAVDLQDEPELAAELMLTVGSVYQSLGYYVHAESLLVDAESRVIAGFGAESYEHARVANVRGDGLLELGRLDEAEALFHTAHRLADAHGGPTDPETLAALANLAGVARRRGDGETALALFRQVLTTSEAAFGADYPGRDQDLNNVAVAFGGIGEYAAADSVHALALDLRLALHGPIDPDVAVSLHNRAEVLANLGRTAAAESLWTRAITVRRELYPDGHSDLAASLTSYAGYLRDYGRLAEAAALLAEAAAMHRRINPAPSQELARTLNGLGTLAYAQGDLDGAAHWLREALDAWRATLGEDSPSAQTTMNNLAVILHRGGRLAEARPLFEKVLAARLRSMEPDALPIAFSRKGLGMLLLDEGQPQEAAAMLAPALARLRQKYGDDSTVVAEVMLGLGECHLAAGRVDEARELIVPAVQALAAGFAADHPMVRRATAVAARLRQQQQRGSR